MHDVTVTLFNFHEATGKWHPTEFRNISLTESNGNAPTPDAGMKNADAAANPAALTELLCGIAAKYLSNVPDANGVNLLYAGV